MRLLKCIRLRMWQHSGPQTPVLFTPLLLTKCFLTVLMLCTGGGSGHLSTDYLHKVMS